MNNTLCFDFGNTRRKLAVFKNAVIEKILVLENDTNETIQALIDEYKPSKSILSSVIDHNPGMEEILLKHTAFHKLNHLTRLTFSTPVGKPETIGADRLALLAAVTHFTLKKIIW